MMVKYALQVQNLQYCIFSALCLRFLHQTKSEAIISSIQIPIIGSLLSVLMYDWPLSKNLNEENINKKLWITSFFKSSILILDVELLLT